jgi:hypothetical protein
MPPFGFPGAIYGAVFHDAQSVIRVLAASTAISVDPAKGGTRDGTHSHSNISNTIHYRG